MHRNKDTIEDNLIYGSVRHLCVDGERDEAPVIIHRQIFFSGASPEWAHLVCDLRQTILTSDDLEDFVVVGGIDAEPVISLGQTEALRATSRVKLLTDAEGGVGVVVVKWNAIIEYF